MSATTINLVAGTHVQPAVERLPLVRGGFRLRAAPALSVAALLLLILLALAAPLLAPAAPEVQVHGLELQPPSLAHPFGTDHLGRDLLSRTLYGLRVSLLTGVLAAAGGGVAGGLLGLLVAYRGGAVEVVLMRIVDGLIAFPTLLLAIGLAAAFGTGLISIVLAIAIVQVPIFARLARAGMLQEKGKDYVVAAISAGADNFRIVFGHILRNALPPLVVQLALAMGQSVAIEASLSFLGIGIASPQPSLGSILDSSRGFLRGQLYYALFPAAALVLLLLGLNGLADTLNELLNPQT
jgi:peptide/nickel transport system permease protein